MASYSLSAAKDNLSRLVDEALAGETVTITRHGKPVVELRPAAKKVPRPMTPEEWEYFRARRDARPPLGEDAVKLLRAMRGHEE